MNERRKKKIMNEKRKGDERWRRKEGDQVEKQEISFVFKLVLWRFLLLRVAEFGHIFGCLCENRKKWFSDWNMQSKKENGEDSLPKDKRSKHSIKEVFSSLQTINIALLFF